MLITRGVSAQTDHKHKSFERYSKVETLQTVGLVCTGIHDCIQKVVQRIIINIHGSGLLMISFIASNTFEMVKAGLQPSFNMSKCTLPAESMLQW
jgi:hypothetical protein